MVPGGMLVLIQPHQHKRPFIAIKAGRKRHPVAALINPVFQPLINGAIASIRAVLDERLFESVAKSDHSFKVRLANAAELERYLHLGQRPPRFPRGGRKRFQALWKARAAGAQIEATEFMTIISLRAIRK